MGSIPITRSKPTTQGVTDAFFVPAIYSSSRVSFALSDNDGLTDTEEAELGTDPLTRDTDGDGWSDKEEVDEGTDPLLAASQPELEAGLPIWLLYQATQ